MTTIPTLSALYNSILADLEAEFTITIPIVGKSFLRAFAAIQAAKLKLLYLTLGKLQKNIFVDTADRESSGGTLERFGRVKLGRDPFPATQGVYSVTINGTIGAIVPALTTFQSNDDAQNPAKLFILDVAYTLVATTDTISLRALESGTGSKLNVGEGLTATAPILNVNSAAVVASETTAPQAAEDIEDYRSKVLQSFRLEPQGGASSDYRLWGLDASGVKQIYPYAKSGAANEVDVFVEATIADSTDGKGTPTATIISEVEDVIELDPDTTLPISERGRRPLGVFAVNVMPIVLVQINVFIYNYDNRTAATDLAIENGIIDLLSLVRPFIAGCDVLSDKNDIVSRNTIIKSILDSVPTSVFTDVEMNVGFVPTITKTMGNGEIPYLASITYA